MAAIVRRSLLRSAYGMVSPVEGTVIATARRPRQAARERSPLDSRPEQSLFGIGFASPEHNWNDAGARLVDRWARFRASGAAQDAGTLSDRGLCDCVSRRHDRGCHRIYARFAQIRSRPTLFSRVRSIVRRWSRTAACRTRANPNSHVRRRLILTRRVPDLAPDPDNPNTWLWNPAGATLEEACAAVGCAGGTMAIAGGTEVFSLFLKIGYDDLLPRARRRGATARRGSGLLAGSVRPAARGRSPRRRAEAGGNRVARPRGLARQMDPLNPASRRRLTAASSEYRRSGRFGPHC